MKNFKHNIIATALLAFSVLSCDKAETPVLEQDDQVTVGYSISFDEATKSIGLGESVNYVWCAAYKVIKDVNGKTGYTLGSQPAFVQIVDGKAKCEVDMVRDQAYKVVFIAQHYEPVESSLRPSYIIDPENAYVMMPDHLPANSDNYDLFGYVDDVVKFDSSINKEVVLSRKVAQVNILTSSSDLATAELIGKTPTHSSMILKKVPLYYCMLDGLAYGSGEVTYSKALVSGLNPNHLTTVFCLSGETISNVEVHEFKVYQNGTELKSYTDIGDQPCKINFKTNISVDYKF